jgi:hypothetical protein
MPRPVRKRKTPKAATESVSAVAAIPAENHTYDVSITFRRPGITVVAVTLVH